MLDLIQNLDGGILLWIQGAVRQEWLDPLVCFYTRLGNGGLMWIALSVVMLCFRPTRKAGGAALCAMLLGVLLNNMIIKEVVARPRPWLSVEGLEYVMYEASKHSFPSGHTCASFAAAAAWRRYAPAGWIGVAGTVLAVLMGLSRMYIGVHYLTDVLVGAVVGTFCGWLACRIWAKAARKKEK